MMETQLLFKMFISNSILMQLITCENVIKVICHESFKPFTTFTTAHHWFHPHWHPLTHNLQDTLQQHPQSPKRNWSSSLQTEILYAFLVFPVCATHIPHHQWFDHTNDIWWHIHTITIIWFSPNFWVFLLPSLRSNYSPQHPVLKCPQTWVYTRT
jgi:hypothetical protein